MDSADGPVSLLALPSWKPVDAKFPIRSNAPPIPLKVGKSSLSLLLPLFLAVRHLVETKAYISPHPTLSGYWTSLRVFESFISKQPGVFSDTLALF